MHINNKILQTILILFLMISCSVHKNNNSRNLSKKLENIIHLPDDYFFPKGDSIYMEIINKGKDLTPLLISKIDDTTNSNCVYADTFKYKVGDIAFFLIDDLYDDEFPIRKMLEKEFNKEKKDYPFFLTLYHEKFFLNSEEQNLINRKRFKRILHKWYKTNK